MGTGEDDSLTNQEAGGDIASVDRTRAVFPDCDDDTDALVASCLSIIDLVVRNL
jgi:hypothetical protein